jgi:uncharacterized membrane protein
MSAYILYAMLAGFAWGLGGFFEKAGLQALKLPPIAGITLRTVTALIILGALSIPTWKEIEGFSNPRAWLMIVIGGGVIAGSLGMWSFYSSLSLTENLGVTLAIAFAFSPLTGTVVGLVDGSQKIDLRIGLGLAAIIIGIVFLQTSQHRSPH